uniref:Uncharacterized protein n=1 Tax=Zea mays TaxID=4577 RepID=C4J8F5_MAIZE|nr:unknown [Zea mays]
MVYTSHQRSLLVGTCWSSCFELFFFVLDEVKKQFCVIDSAVSE